MNTSTLPTYRLIAAGILLLVYLVIAGMLLFALYNPGKDPQPEWDHVLVVFNAIGALATTAVGVLLGVEIQQGNVQAAQNDAQRLAGDVALKDAAMMSALDALEGVGAGAGGAAMGAQPAIPQARAQLQRALGRQSH